MSKDDIQTIQIDYAEAMKMLWRQSQTIKKLQQKNEKLKTEADKWNTAYLNLIKLGIDNACDTGSRIGQLNGWNDELRAENEKLRAENEKLLRRSKMWFKVAQDLGHQDTFLPDMGNGDD